MGLTLKQLLEELEREGVVGQDAEEAVERFMRLRGSRPAATGAIERRAKAEVDFPASPQSDPRNIRRAVDYGEESAEEAYDRWMAQEQADADGIFGGGATAGGIFGPGVVVSEGYDPEARLRQAQLSAARSTAEAQALQVVVLARLAEQLGVSPAEVKQRLLGDAGAAPSRRLKGRR